MMIKRTMQQCNLSPRARVKKAAAPCFAKSKFVLLAMMAVILFAASPAHAVCSFPAGVEGEIIYNGTHNTPSYCDDTNWVAMVGGNPATGGGDYIPNAVEFDGTNDFIEYNSEFTGVTTGTQITISFWFKNNDLAASPQILGNTGNNNIDIRFEQAFGGIRLNFADGATSQIDARTSFDPTADSDWHHVLMSFDLTDVGKRHIYIDDVLTATNWITYTTTGVIDFFGGDFVIGRRAPGSLQRFFEGYLADFWIDADTYIDLSIEANRRKFIDATGNPVYLGANGALPIGTPPDIFLTGDTASWHTNKATGGGLNEIGELTTASTTPYVPRTKIVPTGLIGHWRLDETTGTTAVDSSGSGNNGTWVNTPTPTTNGVIGGALEFDRVSHNYVQVANTGDIFETAPFTISTWVKFDQLSSLLGERQVVARMEHTVAPWHSWQMHLSSADDVFTFQIRNNTASVTENLDTNNPLLAGVWYHIAATVNASYSAVLYVNGVAQTDTGSLGSFYNANGNLRFGGSNGFSTNTDGTMDDMRFYNRALTPAEILAIYSARDGIQYNGNNRTMEFFDQNKWVSMTPTWQEVDKAPIYDCPNIGDVCADGTVYAGLDGTQRIYTTPSDTGTNLCWNNCNNTGTVTVASPLADNILITDSDSITGGFQIHQAADHCANLTDHGHTDWYLPPTNELDVLYNNRVAIGNFSTVTNFYYWRLSQGASPDNGGSVRFDNGNNANISKWGTHNVRCVRKGTLQITGNGGLVGHWKLDETSGTTAVDSSGNGYNGTYSNFSPSITSVPGAVGRSINFSQNALAGNVIISTATAVTNARALTLAGWIYLDANPFLAPIVEKGGMFSFRTTSGSNQFTFTPLAWTTPGGSWRSTSALALNRWYHVAVTYDYNAAIGTPPKIYINGVEEVLSANASPTGPLVTPSNAVNIYIGRRYDSSSSAPRGRLDDVRIYDRLLSTPEISKLYAMGAPVGSVTALPTGCAVIGQVCDDGTIYAGDSPDGTIPMFAAPANAPSIMPWNNGNSSNNNATGALSATAGASNTVVIVGVDADSGTAGFQPHLPAKYCNDLVAYGADDWYLPAKDELNVLYTAKAAIGNFETGSNQFYWSSTEASSVHAARQSFDNGYNSGGQFKYQSYRIRCVRKGPAPRCANPYGVEGSMMYNSTHDVVQFCDGARWRAIGK